MFSAWSQTINRIVKWNFHHFSIISMRKLYYNKMKESNKTQVAKENTNEFLYQLLGSQLIEPSCQQVQYNILLILDLSTVVLYILLQHFLGPTSLKIELKEQYILQYGSTKKILFAIFASFAFIFLNFLIILHMINFFKQSKLQKNILVEKYLKRVINKSNILMKTILFLPFFHLTIGIFQIQYGSNIFSQVAWKIIIIIVLLQFILAALFNYLTPVMNPFTIHPWAETNSLNQAIKCSIKIITAIFIQYNAVFSQKAYYGIIIFLCVLWTFSTTYICQFYQNPQNHIYNCCIATCLWVSWFCFLITFAYQYSILVQILFLLMGLPIAIVTTHTLSQMGGKYLFSKLKNIKIELITVIGVIFTIRKIQRQDSCIYFQHIAKCFSPDCKCRSFLNNIINQKQARKQIQYRFLKDIIQQKLKTISNSVDLTIILAYVDLYRINDTKMPIMLLAQLKNSNTGFFQRFKIKILQKDIQQFFKQKNSSQQPFKLNICKYYQAQRLFSDFKKSLFLIAQKILSFWKIVLTSQYDKSQLYKVFLDIAKNSNQIQKQFDQCQKSNPNNKELIKTYMQFSQKLLSEEALNLQNKFDQINKNIDADGKYMDHFKALFLSNSNPSLISVFANQKKFNTIHYMNPKFLSDVSFMYDNIIGHPLEKLIPSPFQQGHSQLLKQYSENTESVQKVQKDIKILDSKNNIIETRMAGTIIQTIQEQVLFISIMNIQQETQNLIFVNNQGNIYGYSKKFTQKYGFPSQKQLMQLIPDISLNQLLNGDKYCTRLNISDNNNIFMKQIENQILEVNLSLKKSEYLFNKKYYTLSVSPINQTINSEKKLSQNQQYQKSLNLEEGNGVQFQDKKNIKQIHQVLFRAKGSSLLFSAKIIGVFAILVFIGINVYTIFRFRNQMNSIDQHFQSLLFLSKISLRMADTAWICRKLNLHSYFRPYDVESYQFHNQYFKTSVKKTSTQYYIFGTNMMILTQKGFDDRNFKTPFEFFLYPNRSQMTELHATMTMYMQSIIYFGKVKSSNITFSPKRQLNQTNIPIFKKQLQQVIINSYSTIIPAFDLITPKIHEFYKNLTLENSMVEIIIVVLVLCLVIILCGSVILLDCYYTKKIENTMSLVLEMQIEDIKAIISTIQSFQFRAFPQYYQSNIAQTFFYFFYQEDRNNQKEENCDKIRGKNLSNLSNTNMNVSQMPIKTIKKRSKKISGRKQSNKSQIQQRQKFVILFKNKYYAHFIAVFIFGIIILAFFSTDLTIRRSQTIKLVEVTDQLYYILFRLRTISTLRLTTIQSLFQVQTWPTGLKELAKKGRTSLLQNEQKIPQFKQIYSWWNPKILQIQSIDICSDPYYYSQNNDYPNSIQNCSNTLNGVLKKGLGSSIATFNRIAQDLYSLPVMNDSAIGSLAFSQLFLEWNDLTQYIMVAMKSIRNRFQKHVPILLQQNINLKQKRSYFFIPILVILLSVWIFIINKINRIRIQTKKLLHILTFKRIQNTPSIRNAILTKNIFQYLE